MFVNTHIVPVKKEDSNKGSCGKMAEYLSKEDDSLFFSHDRDDIETDEAVEMIDKHSKGQIAKDQAKWYSPVYSLSNDECRHIVKRMFNKDYEHYHQLTPSEQTQYNNFLIYLGRRFQDKMAENFEKQNLGIHTGADLVYVGKVENDRVYKYFDEDVRLGRAKAGEPKPGFNSHIHIIQSRKANNAKKSKISPNASNIKMTHDNFGNGAVQGFAKERFCIMVEAAFDQATKYNREYAASFEYRLNAKRNRMENSKGEARTYSTTKNTDMVKKKFYTQEEQDQISKSSSLVDYFFSLADRGIIKYEGRKGNDYIFNDLNQKSGSIFVSEDKGWNYWGKGSGKILNAVKFFEGVGHKEALDFLVDRNGFNNYDFKNEAIYAYKKEKGTKSSPSKILSKGDVSNPYILNYFLTRGISADIINANVQEVKYERNGKTYTSGGIENIAGGFNVRTQNFKGVVGDNNDISVIEGSRDVLIFEGLVSYLSYLQLNNIVRAQETVIIMNSVANTKSLFSLLETRGIDRVAACVDADSAGDAFMKSLKENFKGRIDDLRGEYNLTEEVDLNDRLIIDQIKNVSRKF